MSRVELEVLGDLEDVAIDHELLSLVLAAGALRRNLDDDVGRPALFPEQVVVARRKLRDAVDDEDVGREVPAAPTASE